MQKPTPNASVVENAKSILENFGYKIKTGHIYEMFARVCSYKSWNHASAANIDFLEHLPTVVNPWPESEHVELEDFALPISNPKAVWNKLLSAIDETSIMLRHQGEVQEALESVLDPSDLWQAHSNDLCAVFVEIWRSERTLFFDRFAQLTPSDPACAGDFQKHLLSFEVAELIFMWFAFPSRTMALTGLRAHYRAKVMEKQILRGKVPQMRNLRSLARFLERIPDEAYAHVRAHLPLRILKLYDTPLELFPVPAGS